MTTPVGPAPSAAPYRTIDTTSVAGDFVVVHSLTTLAGVCLNRDMDGLPKTMLFGGTERLRVSSQALIRPARTWIRTHSMAGEQGASSRLLPHQTALCLQERDIDPADAVPAALLAVIAAGLSVDPAEPDRTRAMTYVPASAPERLAQVVLDHWDDTDVPRKEMETRIATAMRTGPRARGRKKPPPEDIPATDLTDSLPTVMVTAAREAFAPGLALDIALFGRFLAEIPGGKIRSAVNVAHATSVDPHTLFTDDFTAVDDWNTGGLLSVGMLGSQHLSSGTLYRWACLNRHQLRENLAASGAEGDEVEQAAQRAERLFTTAITYTLPNARSSRTGSAALPTLAIAATSDIALTAAAAFETPIDPPAGEEAAARLAAYLDSAAQLNGGTARWLSPTGADAPPLPDTLTVEGH
ncbi:type I-E CRISPR-associated protein Cas7/Cse4/CasC [Streptomyces cellulosae]|uniref:Type I-E CRISPR-associated protein Cas7/Cse4/CasC n=1 Tax=Streptomyces althioticus TaxID=83380 RepID=A0ABZ1YJX4_9ACTN|nr:type I-E CRISPR-associated protein Cas7/Cse4/CasC [Streptomyces cellulosae]WTB86546.1 type I-E CRISPR-associated protein Cas7/Cse4/CasC [Streptomyces cellulosae]WTB93355.1 type I-E CRISPR-associated protein Cas7/Cse4/CasC [Streptomyces cellulosae]WTC60747.1 type I-E CRISPR-associated protein Cas7/Cse4/CasC [Streptomyces cellulosae]